MRMGTDKLEELRNFHWDPSRLIPAPPKPEPRRDLHWYYMEKKTESWAERVKRMLTSMHGMVLNCTMCHLGRQMCDEQYTGFDPHVFSNMQPSQWMIVGQNPGFNECMEQLPFVGESGKYFDRQLLRFGLQRKDFYISNAVRCHTIGNARPTSEHISSCEPILRMELMLLKPKLVVALGAVSFGAFCPKLGFSDNFGQICKSDKFGVKVIPLYHPSPRNINITERRVRFEKDLKMICMLVRAHRKKHAERNKRED